MMFFRLTIPFALISVAAASVEGVRTGPGFEVETAAVATTATPPPRLPNGHPCKKGHNDHCQSGVCAPAGVVGSEHKCAETRYPGLDGTVF